MVALLLASVDNSNFLLGLREVVVIEKWSHFLRVGGGVPSLAKFHFT